MCSKNEIIFAFKLAKVEGNHCWNGRGEYVGKDGQTTNNAENFFGVFKLAMRGTYVFCSE